jgi:hypothetical protein
MKTLMQQHPDYWLFHSMKKRCLNPNHRMYRYYGGKGVRICDRWMQPRGKGFTNFLTDMGARPDPSLTLDRIDSSGHYEPENCRWATRKTQYENRSTTIWLEHDGIRLTATQWAACLGLAKGQSVTERLKDGVPLAIALTQRRLKKDPRHFAKAVAAAAVVRRARTHCKRGHPLSGENLQIYINPRGQRARVCKACKRS